MVRVFGILALSILSCCVAFAKEGIDAEELPSVAEVFASFVEANGGHTNIQSITSIIVSGRIELADGQEQEFKLYRKRPDLMRLRLELSEFSVDTIFDGESAYRRIVGDAGKGEYIALDEGETESIKQDSTIEGPFYILVRDYGALSLVGVDEVRDEECYRFDVAEEHPSAVRSVWVSVEDSREVKLLRRSMGADDQPVEQAVFFSDFRKVHGLSVAQSIEYWTDGKKTQHLSIEEVRANAGIFDKFFSVE